LTLRNVHAQKKGKKLSLDEEKKKNEKYERFIYKPASPAQICAVIWWYLHVLHANKGGEMAGVISKIFVPIIQSRSTVLCTVL